MVHYNTAGTALNTVTVVGSQDQAHVWSVCLSPFDGRVCASGTVALWTPLDAGTGVVNADGNHSTAVTFPSDPGYSAFMLKFSA